MIDNILESRLQKIVEQNHQSNKVVLKSIIDNLEKSHLAVENPQLIIESVNQVMKIAVNKKADEVKNATHKVIADVSKNVPFALTRAIKGQPDSYSGSQALSNWITNYRLRDKTNRVTNWLLNSKFRGNWHKYKYGRTNYEGRIEKADIEHSGLAGHELRRTLGKREVAGNLSKIDWERTYNPKTKKVKVKMIGSTPGKKRRPFVLTAITANNAPKAVEFTSKVEQRFYQKTNTVRISITSDTYLNANNVPQAVRKIFFNRVNVAWKAFREQVTRRGSSIFSEMLTERLSKLIGARR